VAAEICESLLRVYRSKDLQGAFDADTKGGFAPFFFAKMLMAKM